MCRVLFWGLGDPGRAPWSSQPVCRGRETLAKSFQKGTQNRSSEGAGWGRRAACCCEVMGHLTCSGSFLDDAQAEI